MGWAWVLGMVHFMKQGQQSDWDKPEVSDTFSRRDTLHGRQIA
jgi:hypothetical protein